MPKDDFGTSYSSKSVSLSEETLEGVSSPEVAGEEAADDEGGEGRPLFFPRFRAGRSSRTSEEALLERRRASSLRLRGREGRAPLVSEGASPESSSEPDVGSTAGCGTWGACRGPSTAEDTLVSNRAICACRDCKLFIMMCISPIPVPVPALVEATGERARGVSLGVVSRKRCGLLVGREGRRVLLWLS